MRMDNRQNQAMLNIGRERRRDPRFPIEKFNFDLELPARNIAVKGIDISRGGFSFLSDTQKGFERGVIINIVNPELTVALEATVLDNPMVPIESPLMEYSYKICCKFSDWVDEKSVANLMEMISQIEAA